MSGPESVSGARGAQLTPESYREALSGAVQGESDVLTRRGTVRLRRKLAPVTTCPSCGRSEPSGLLCAADTAAVITMLAAVPQLVEQLDVAASKQAKIGGGGKAGKGSIHERSPVNWDAVHARDLLLIEAGMIEVPAIRRHPNVAELIGNLGHAVKQAYRALDRAQERVYLGVCLNTDELLVCHAELWARPGAVSVTCTQCEVVHDVGERRAWLMEQARGLLFTPREASQYIGEVGGIPVGQQRIRNYLDRKAIPVRPSADGVLRLLFGDLLDKVRDEAERKSA